MLPAVGRVVGEFLKRFKNECNGFFCLSSKIFGFDVARFARSCRRLCEDLRNCSDSMEASIIRNCPIGNNGTVLALYAVIRLTDIRDAFEKDVIYRTSSLF